jgi:predicted Zn-dependent protease
MAYGEENNEGMASLASGESAILNGQVPEAKLHARRAMRLLPEGSPEWLQANDILREAENLAKQERRHFGF